MTTTRKAAARRASTDPAPAVAADRARRVIDVLGGRFAKELGIAVDESDDEVERWFLAATLFGTRISAPVAERTYEVLANAGVRTVADVKGRGWQDLVELLDRGGYARYDYRTATRLQELATVIELRHDGRIASLGHDLRDPTALEAALDALPGWGPVTVNLFLRELRGIWPGATRPLDARADWSARHLRLLGRSRVSLDRLTTVARSAGVDVRELEAALVRFALRHRATRGCPGGTPCRLFVGADAASS